MDRGLLNRSTSVVLYRQLASVLRQHFRESQMQVGTRIPTEFELTVGYGVSRGTVRQALDLLEKEGLIVRVPGLGTFLKKEVALERPSSQRQIGLIVPQVQDQLSLNILVGVESVAKFRGYQVVFNHSNESLEQEKADIDRMIQNGVSGIIIFPVSNQEYDESIWELHRTGFPFVLVDRYFPTLDCDTIVADNVEGGYWATEHLILLGYKEIAFVYHPQADFRTTAVRDRFTGYRSALEDYHIDFRSDWLAAVDEPPADTATEDTLLQPYLEYLRQPGRPKALFTVNDLTAISLVAAAARLGLKIPEELAIVGFDNIKMATQIQYPLTTINQDRTELGVRAAHLLLGRIDGHVGKPERIMIPTNLVVRESCGARKRIIGGPA